MKMKRAISMFLTSVFVIAAMNVSAFSDEKISVVVNGESIDFTGDQPPVIKNDRVLVPFRMVFEKMGAEVMWFDDIKLCEATYGSVTVGIEIGNNIVTLGEGASVESDVPAQIINNRTMVPLRILSESIGAQVEWDSVTKTATITTPKITEESPVSIEYEITKSGVRNADTGATINYSYPVVTTEYTFKDKLNSVIEKDIIETMDKLSKENTGREEINAECVITYNDAGIFAFSCMSNDEEIYKAAYGISNGAELDENIFNNDIPTEDSIFEIKRYDVYRKAKDGYNFIIAGASYPMFFGDSQSIASINTQLENSAKKSVDSFIESYKEDAINIYDNPPQHLFEPPYNFSVDCEVSVDESIATITYNGLEVLYGKDDRYFKDIIKINIETWEVIE